MRKLRRLTIAEIETNLANDLILVHASIPINANVVLNQGQGR